MKSPFVPKVSAVLAAGVMVILVLIPFHAFLSVWAASLSGHYTLWRLWKEFLLLPLAALAIYMTLRNPMLRQTVKESLLIKIMLTYLVLYVVLGLVALKLHAVNKVALYEGLIEDMRLMVIFLVAWVAAATRRQWLRTYWRQLLLIPAAIVVAFGLLQVLVLPANFLSHFGYGPSTINPYELVDLNSHFVRVQSTLRGANPLGAYLVVIIAAVAALLGGLKGSLQQKVRRYWWLILLGIATLIVLYFTYSRSAFLGAILALITVGLVSIKQTRIRNGLLLAVLAVCLVVGGGVFLLRHNMRVEDTFFHTSQHSPSAESSNQNRASALESGLHDVLHQPFGRGPGTAGPASEHNNHPARIAENYFLQIGQEVGWLGLTLFVIINVLIGRRLWEQRGAPDKLPLALLASLVGLTVVNMLSHAWADDTLAYIWWGFAGIALAAKQQHKT